jgi:hypothetical protein
MDPEPQQVAVDRPPGPQPENVEEDDEAGDADRVSRLQDVIADREGELGMREIMTAPGVIALSVTAASEIARNTVDYGGGGTLCLELLREGARRGVRRPSPIRV